MTAVNSHITDSILQAKVVELTSDSCCQIITCIMSAHQCIALSMMMSFVLTHCQTLNSRFASSSPTVCTVVSKLRQCPLLHFAYKLFDWNLANPD